MKQVVQIMLMLGMIGMVLTGNAYAQPSQNESSLVGNFRTQAALVLSDVLVLDKETTDKVVELYQKVGEKRRQEWQNSGVDFQSMSNEERRKFFNTYRQNVAADMKKELKEVVSEKQLEQVEFLMMLRVIFPDPELRGLRMIELKDEQREKIQPLALSLGKKIVPSQFRFFGEQMDEAEREKAQKTFEEEKKSFLEGVNNVLSEEQQEAWKEKIAAINKELKELRERMSNFQRQQ